MAISTLRCFHPFPIQNQSFEVPEYVSIREAFLLRITSTCELMCQCSQQVLALNAPFTPSTWYNTMAPIKSCLPALLVLSASANCSRLGALVARDVECCPCSRSTPTVTVTISASSAASTKTITITPSNSPPPPGITITVTAPSSVTKSLIQTVTVTNPGHEPGRWPLPLPQTVTVTSPAPDAGTTHYETIYISDSTVIRPSTVTLTRTLSPSILTSVSTITASQAPPERGGKPPRPFKPATVTVSHTTTVSPTTVYVDDHTPVTVTSTVTQPQKSTISHSQGEPKSAAPSSGSSKLSTWTEPLLPSPGPPERNHEPETSDAPPHHEPTGSAWDWNWNWDQDQDQPKGNQQPSSSNLSTSATTTSAIPTSPLTTKTTYTTKVNTSSKLRTATATITAAATAAATAKAKTKTKAGVTDHDNKDLFCTTVSTTRLTVFNTITTTIHPTVVMHTPPPRLSLGPMDVDMGMRR